MSIILLNSSNYKENEICAEKKNVSTFHNNLVVMGVTSVAPVSPTRKVVEYGALFTDYIIKPWYSRVCGEPKRPESSLNSICKIKIDANDFLRPLKKTLKNPF